MSTNQLALLDAPPAAVVASPRPCLHCSPPLTPAGLIGHRQRLLAGLGVALAVLAVAALGEPGVAAVGVGRPVQRFVEDARSSWATSIVRRISFLGSTMVVLALGCVLAAAAWRRCPRRCGRRGRRHVQPAVAGVHAEGACRPRSPRPRAAGPWQRAVVPERSRHGSRRPVGPRPPRRGAVQGPGRGCGGQRSGHRRR